MKRSNVTKRICGTLCLLGLVFLIADASAAAVAAAPLAPQAITINEYIDLAAYPSDPLPGWVASGGAYRGGITITSSSNTRTYTRSDVAMGAGQAFMIEAVVSADPISAAGYRGARIWAKFYDASAPFFPPGDKSRYVELRMIEDAGGGRRFSLCDAISGSEVVSITANWAAPGDRYRVRLKRQQIDGSDYIVLQAEKASGWDDPDDRNPDPDTPTSKKVLVSTLQFDMSVDNELGFGHHSLPSGDFASDWVSVHVTGTDSSTDELPYWPSLPPVPALTITTADPPHDVDSQADLSAGAYFTNDSATLVLDTLSGELSSAPISDPSAPPGQHVETFTGLAGSQVVTGWVEVADVSGRTRIGPSANTYLPPPTAVTLSGFEAAPVGGDILVEWTTAIEIDTVGFNLYRSQSPGGDWVRLNDTLIPSQAPGAPSGADYTWLDEDVQDGITYYYKLEDVGIGGQCTFHGPIAVQASDPTAVMLRALSTRSAPSLLLLATLIAASGLVATWWIRKQSTET